jgi:hypothetical protein
VEQTVLGRAVALGGEPHCVPAERPAEERDVGLLARLEHAEVGVDGGGRGDHPGRRAGSANGVGVVIGGVVGLVVGDVVGVVPATPTGSGGHDGSSVRDGTER